METSDLNWRHATRRPACHSSTYPLVPLVTLRLDNKGEVLRPEFGPLI